VVDVSEHAQAYPGETGGVLIGTPVDRRPVVVEAVDECHVAQRR
jgi:hypothetical protein